MASGQRKHGGGVLSTVAELAVSFGGYYLLRAFGVGVFWSLTAPGFVVAAIAVLVTVRRARIDLIGLLVLVEITTTIVLSLATHSARLAAVREPAYILVGGVFCLVTLVYRRPLTHVSTASVATFGDPKREAAFRRAWDMPRYRLWQRLLTGAIGVLMIGAALIRAAIIWLSSDAGLAHAVNESNVVTIVMIGAIVVVSAIGIQVPRKIIEELAAEAAHPDGTSGLRMRSPAAFDDQFPDPLRVGLALRRLHHGADDRARRGHLAAADLLRDVRLRGQRLVDRRDQRRVVRDDLQAARRDDLVRLALAGQHAVHDLPGQLRWSAPRRPPARSPWPPGPA